jgi:hypothetical protein
MSLRWLTGVSVFVVTCASAYAASPTNSGSFVDGRTPPNVPAHILQKVVPQLNNGGTALKQTQVDPALRIQGLTLSALSADVQFEGTPGWTYSVQHTANLSSTNWAPLGSATVGGQGNAVFNDSRSRTQPAQFYRISKREPARATVSMLSGLLLPEGTAAFPMAVSTSGTNVLLNTKKEQTK